MSLGTKLNMQDTALRVNIVRQHFWHTTDIFLQAFYYIDFTVFRKSHELTINMPYDYNVNTNIYCTLDNMKLACNYLSVLLHNTGSVKMI